MSKDEIISEINKVLDKFSDSSLEELLAFIKKMETENKDLFASSVVNKILAEDHQLLEKL